MPFSLVPCTQYLAHRALPSYGQHSSLARTLSNGHEAPIEEQVGGLTVLRES